MFTQRMPKLVVCMLTATILTACGGSGSEQAQAVNAGLSSTSELSNQEFSKPVLSARDAGSTRSANQYASGRVIVKLKDQQADTRQSLTTVARGLGFKVIKEIDFGAQSSNASGQRNAQSRDGQSSLKMAVLDIQGSGLSVQQAVEKLKANPAVAYAEPDYVRKSNLTPADPNYSFQWHLNNTGQSISGVAGSVGTDIRAQNAWNITTGSNGAGAPVIAVIDCGFKLNHADLTNAWWVNPSPGASGISNDLNGADLALNDGDPTYTNSCTHGTNVAGVIGATGNNNVGVTGVMWFSRMMALKVEDNSGIQYTTAIISAINYALGRKTAGVNLKVINMSLGGDEFSQAEYDALAAANAAGVLVVASAGNDGTTAPNYPASYQLPNIISVAASNNQDQLASFSNRGGLVHIAAPGVGIATTSISAGNDSYEYTNGTSFSAPIVSGIAGLLWSAQPGLTMQQVRQRILSTADYKPGFTNLMQVPGRVNALSALNNTQNTYFPPYFESQLQYVQNATHIFSATAPIGASTTGVVAVVNGVETALRDDGQYPDKFAGDGRYAGVVKSASVGDVPLSIKHRFGATGNLQESFSSGTITYGLPYNYKVTTAAYEWDEPEGSFGSQTRFSALADETLTSVTTPFPIRFYGLNSLDKLLISDNGFICITPDGCSGLSAGSFFSGKPIPGTGSLRAGWVAPWWNDWVLSGNATSNVYVQTLGTAPNRRFVITWKNAYAYTGSGTTYTDGVSFQAKFYEGQNAVTFSYLDVTTNVAVGNTYRPDGGLVGSSGVQFYNGAVGTRLSYNQANSIVAQTTKLLNWTTSFNDITQTGEELAAVEGLKGSYITVGCNGGATYCPFDNVNRMQMAIFLSRGVRGHDLLFDYTTVPNANFLDLTDPKEIQYASSIKQKGITNGCQGGTKYCPQDVVNREAMALFLIRATRGSTYVPTAGTGLFADAPVGDSLAGYFEELRRMGITNGCQGGTAYCRYDPVNRLAMGLFLQRAFQPWDYK
jgi:Subtilase family